jgi:hypothetical protein
MILENLFPHKLQHPAHPCNTMAHLTATVGWALPCRQVDVNLVKLLAEFEAKNCIMICRFSIDVSYGCTIIKDRRTTHEHEHEPTARVSHVWH